MSTNTRITIEEVLAALSVFDGSTESYHNAQLIVLAHIAQSLDSLATSVERIRLHGVDAAGWEAAVAEMGR